MHTPDPELLRWLRPQLLEQIPLARAMQLDIAELDAERVVLRAPLAPNVNDKGCAFGGSIGALLTLSGWSLLTSRARSAGLECGIYIQDSQLSYLKPAWDQLEAHARIDGADVQRWVLQYGARRRARIEVQSDLYSGGVHAARMQARYVALPL